MATHQIETARQWPRVRDMPRCSICSNSMVAPEASVLKSNGSVSYVWSCDCCGHAFVTDAAVTNGVRLCS